MAQAMVDFADDQGYDIEDRRTSTPAVQLHLDMRVRYFIAGAVGGPLVVGLMTPARNAMTLAATDSSSFSGLYRRVFSRGLRGAYCGASTPVLAASPQFVCVGPIYVLCERATGSAHLGLLGASVCESLCSFAAARRNARVQYNVLQPSADTRLAQESWYRWVGPGYVCNVMKNVFAALGIRVLSGPCERALQRTPGIQQMHPDGLRLAADLSTSMFGAACSMPFNHMCSWSFCNASLQRMSWLERGKQQLGFLRGEYFRPGGLATFSRDIRLRIVYTSLVTTGYSTFERFCTRACT